MNIDIRRAVIANLKEANHDMVEETVTDAVKEGEEKTLPGLGVFFELLWNSSNPTEKNKIIDSITTQLHS